LPTIPVAPTTATFISNNLGLRLFQK